MTRPGRLLPVAAALLFLLTLPVGASQRGLTLSGPSPLSDEALGTYYALIVGINDYREWTPLQTAVKDATALRDVLVGQYGFPEENVILRTDDQATRLQIIHDLRNLAASLGDKDNLLVYFAGHGQLDDLTGDGYWIPVEGKLKNPGTWISHATLKGLLGSEKVRAKNVVVVADSCYSGTLLRGGPSLLGMDERSYERKLAEASSRRSRQVITSGGLEPVADGGRDGHSLFAFYLLKALRENDRRVVDLENLFHTRVWEPVTQIGGQRPNVGRLKTPMDEDGQFVLQKRVRNDLSAEETARLREAAREQKRLEAELARLEAERRRLEQERRLLEERKKLEELRLALEREKQRLAIETERKRLELENARQGEEKTDLPPPPAPRPTERNEITVALLPGHVDYQCQYATRVDADTIGVLALGEILSSPEFRPTHASYRSDRMDASSVQPVHLDPGKAERLWHEGGFFSEPEPDTQAAAETGRELGVDVVFMFRVVNASQMCDAEMTQFLIDTATGETITESETLGYRAFPLATKQLARKLLLQRLATLGK